jgi:hypothetical protein
VRRFRFAALLALAAAAGTTPPAGANEARSAGPTAAYVSEVQAWRDRRVTRLRSETGWLTVAGLYWLEPGENTFGTAPENDFVLPAGSAPARAGVLFHENGTTTVRASPRAGLTCGGKPVRELRLRSDTQDTTDVVELGRLRFFVIERGGRAAIRLRDLESPQRTGFRGIDAWPIDAAWRVEARFEPFLPPRRIPIANIIGTLDSMLCPGRLRFELAGTACELLPVLESPSDDEYFLIFSDATSGQETYPAGRFLYAPLAVDGRTTLDFNKAYNPPCAFTPYATCPLPPPQNELPVAVRAGEKNYEAH